MPEQLNMHDVASISRTYLWILRFVVASTSIMIVIAGVFCLVKGASTNSIYILLLVNILISTLMAGTAVCWYRKGDIGMNNHWVLIVVGVAIIYQCIATDIYVFHAAPPGPAYNGTTSNWTDVTPGHNGTDLLA